ncbi:23S rRNA gene intervening sequence Orf [Leptospira borgpetersenii serovar Hardjo-bovis str. JB197]|uniref:23S rRNA gene intervening sequence Orf n=1 Tax=Leptospira borgpetersenii serovar Hardjo-bovis (strain JB197) TaxID=355277 RepID=Q04UD3_LEPBJ|nr:23S rRNA gene intervening sequence Orf [Leptospira borgpetersenii serovar Hardjo-bovis str. JB197]ABJ75487.1 23S rRNA gene intervening sequence Orf [Leptospira borgpetersenii serovar Hardjo-bovis str. JB197]
MDKIRKYEDLEVYRKSYLVSLEIHKKTLEFPKEEQCGLASQLRNSSKSICGNIAEGFGKQSQSKQEFRRFLSMTIGSADETKVWLNYAKDLGYITESLYTSWKGTYVDIAKMLSGLYKSWE